MFKGTVGSYGWPPSVLRQVQYKGEAGLGLETVIWIARIEDNRRKSLRRIKSDMNKGKANSTKWL